METVIEIVGQREAVLSEKTRPGIKGFNCRIASKGGLIKFFVIEGAAVLKH